jgi:hypothetical protein
MAQKREDSQAVFGTHSGKISVLKYPALDSENERDIEVPFIHYKPCIRSHPYPLAPKQFCTIIHDASNAPSHTDFHPFLALVSKTSTLPLAYLV